VKVARRPVASSATVPAGFRPGAATVKVAPPVNGPTGWLNWRVIILRLAGTPVDPLAGAMAVTMGSIAASPGPPRMASRLPEPHPRATRIRAVAPASGR